MAAGTDTHNLGCTFQGAAPNTDNQTHRYPHRMPPKAPDTDNLGTDTLASTPKCYGNFHSTGDTDVSPVTQSGGSICDGTNTIVGGTGAIVS